MIFVTMAEFGKWIQNEINKRGWTQSDLARESGMHTFAIEYLRNGGDIYTLKYILGHSNLTMCMRHLAIINSDASNSHAKASPVDNWL